MHKKLAQNTGLKVYFADPHSHGSAGSLRALESRRSKNGSGADLAPLSHLMI
ncbi:hypothetical protein GCM10027399_05400 [Curvibacter fontanus]